MKFLCVVSVGLARNSRILSASLIRGIWVVPRISSSRVFGTFFCGGVQISDLANDTHATTLQIFDLARVDCNIFLIFQKLFKEAVFENKLCTWANKALSLRLSLAASSEAALFCGGVQTSDLERVDCVTVLIFRIKQNQICLYIISKSKKGRIK